MTVQKKIKVLQDYYHFNDRKMAKIANTKLKIFKSWKSGAIVPGIEEVKTLCEYFSLVPFYFIQEKVRLKPASELDSYEVVLDSNIYNLQQKRIKEEQNQKIGEKVVDECIPNEDNMRYEEND